MTISSQTAPPAVLTVEEAAKLLRISRQSAYQGARAGELPTVKIGRRLLVPRHALEAMLGLTNDASPVDEPGSGHDYGRTGPTSGP
jgi:excisionase family DNA binding protein